MLNKTAYPTTIKNISDLHKAKQYHQVKLIEKEALIRANAAILKSKYEHNTLLGLFKNSSESSALLSFFKQGSDLLIDFLLGGKSPLIRLFSKNLVTILSKNYQDKIQEFSDKIMRIFKAIINR
jgi:hypothetical protein